MQITTLQAEGHVYQALGRRFGVAHTTISRVVQRYQETLTHDRRRGQGRPRVTTAVEDRFIRILALRERYTTAYLQIQLAKVHGTRVSDNKVRRCLAEHNYRPRRPAIVLPSTRAHRRVPLAFPTNTFTGLSTIGQRCSLWRVSLYASDRHARVYRRPTERFTQCNVLQVLPFVGLSVMVWGGISLSGWGLRSCTSSMEALLKP